MIELTHGNLLQAPVQALVNTVNTDGVMGKGIALQFKRAFPQMSRAYEAACKAGEVKLGHMQVVDVGGLGGGPRWIINFPTKDHWRARSRLEDIDSGLLDLVATVRRLGMESIAVPPLGCGHGGLDWRDVRPKIESAFARLPSVHVLIYPHAHAAPGLYAVHHIVRPRGGVAVGYERYDMVVEGLWLGDHNDALSFDGERLCVLETGCSSSQHWVPILERPSPGGLANIDRLDEAADLISEFLGKGAKLLVHCGAGIERSPLTCAWWLRRTGACATLREAYAHLMELRPIVADRTEWLPPEARWP